MTDEPKKDAPPPPPPLRPETWSAISQGDLGLKAVYRTLPNGPFSFRDIVGWVTYNVDDGPYPPSCRNGFVAVVLSDWHFPVFAWNVPGYIGVVPRAFDGRDVQQFIDSGPKQDPPINVRGVGQA